MARPNLVLRDPPHRQPGRRASSKATLSYLLTRQPIDEPCLSLMDLFQRILTSDLILLRGKEAVQPLPGEWEKLRTRKNQKQKTKAAEKRRTPNRPAAPGKMTVDVAGVCGQIAILRERSTLGNHADRAVERL